MSWADTMKAHALAALAERTSTARQPFVATSSGVCPRDVWLTRVRQPRELTARSSTSEPSTRPRLDTAARDWIPRW
jgi:hypothetical protein